MAYGQGMMLDSIRNVLNRRQAARAEDDQFQLAQDRGESALERLRAQADMSTARAQAQGENDMLKEHLRALVNMRGQDKKIEQAGVSADGYVRSAETRGQYDNQGRGITAASMLDRQQAKIEADKAAQEALFGQQSGQGALQRASNERIAAMRGAYSERNTKMMTDSRYGPQWAAARLKSVDENLSRVRAIMGALENKHLDSMADAGTKNRQERQAIAKQKAVMELESMGIGAEKMSELEAERDSLIESMGRSGVGLGPVPGNPGGKTKTVESSGTSATGNQAPPPRKKIVVGQPQP